MLEGISEFEDAVKAQCDLENANESYKRALGTLIKKMKSWRGNDSITCLYRQVFDSVSIVDYPPHTMII
jgi:hypothetical protein